MRGQTIKPQYYPILALFIVVVVIAVSRGGTPQLSRLLAPAIFALLRSLFFRSPQSNIERLEAVIPGATGVYVAACWPLLGTYLTVALILVTLAAVWIMTRGTTKAE